MIHHLLALDKEEAKTAQASSQLLANQRQADSGRQEGGTEGSWEQCEGELGAANEQSKLGMR